MVSSAPYRYRRWFEYEKDSHTKVLASLASVPSSRQTSEALQDAVDLMAHVVASRSLWLHRFGVAPAGPHDLFPRGVSLADLSHRTLGMHAEWSQYLGGLTEAELARVFEYRSTEGPRFRNIVEDILTQLFGHSWYHRGQIAWLLRSVGAEPAVTDFVFWTREKIEGVEGE